MGLSQTTLLALSMLFFGLLAFILGVTAELKKPPFGTAIPGKDVVICKFPRDPTVALGALSTISVLISAGIGILAVYFPYNCKSVPTKALFASSTLRAFYFSAILLTIAGAGATTWNTVIEGLHHVRNVHADVDYSCPTAKTGLFGGAAFLSLDASLLWLICLLLVGNAREDYFAYDADDNEINGDYAQVAPN